MGGLVARAAWYYLGLVGAQNLVRRIVTLGTPHYGSYSTYDLKTGFEPTVRQLANINGYVWGSSSPPVVPPGTTALDAITQILNSWPSTYQLLPFAGQLPASLDPQRPLVFDATNWDPRFGINAALLADAFTGWSNFILATGTQPPPSVLVNLVGVQSGSVNTTFVQDTHYSPPRLHPGTPLDGDGKVAAVNASLPSAGEVVQIQCAHADLPNYAATSGLLTVLIRQKNPVPVAAGQPIDLDFTQPLPKLAIPSETDLAPEPGFLHIIDVPGEIVACLPVLGDPPFPFKGRNIALPFPIIREGHC